MSPGGPTMVWPEGAILKIQASRWSKIALEIDFSLKKKEKVLLIQFFKRPFWKKLLGGS